MAFEPWQPLWPGGRSPHADDELKPADEDVIRTLAEIEKASTPLPSATSNTPIGPGVPKVPAPLAASAGQPSVSVRLLVTAIGMAVGIGLVAANLALRHTLPASRQSYRGRNRIVTRSALDASLQTDAEQLLQKVAAGDSGAASQVLEESAGWTGKTQRTQQSEQWIGVALNLPDLHARAAAIRAELALDGVTVDESGLRTLEQSVSNPSQRVWALWMLGAIGNRGVDPVHTAKIVETYLSDPQVDVRAAAVNGLAMIATDETIPMMLDRFRNDPSPVVQERAACSLAEAGMYTHEQRMTAAGTLVTWLDDPLITGQQRGWTLQALHDISGQSLGSDSAPWRNWYEGAK
jgi:hypothetical protein